MSTTGRPAAYTLIWCCSPLARAFSSVCPPHAAVSCMSWQYCSKLASKSSSSSSCSPPQPLVSKSQICQCSSFSKANATKGKDKKGMQKEENRIKAHAKRKKRHKKDACEIGYTKGTSMCEALLHILQHELRRCTLEQSLVPYPNATSVTFATLYAALR